MVHKDWLTNTDRPTPSVHNEARICTLGNERDESDNVVQKTDSNQSLKAVHVTKVAMLYRKQTVINHIRQCT